MNTLSDRIGDDHEHPPVYIRAGGFIHGSVAAIADLGDTEVFELVLVRSALLPISTPTDQITFKSMGVFGRAVLTTDLAYSDKDQQTFDLPVPHIVLLFLRRHECFIYESVVIARFSVELSLYEIPESCSI